jgi:putative hydrolase of the HAD superfamily
MDVNANDPCGLRRPYVYTCPSQLQRKEDLRRGMMSQNEMMRIETVLFDFGGVLADEGFKNGLEAIARHYRLEPEPFIRTAFDVIYATGYVLGKTDEHSFWNAVRKLTGIDGGDVFLRGQILSRFILRDWMMEIVKTFRGSNIRTGILSDQTDWLDHLDRQYDFFKWFDVVFNSYHMGKGKRDPEHFKDVLAVLKTEGKRVLFIDDDAGHCERARSWGIQVIHYSNKRQFLAEILNYLPDM